MAGERANGGGGGGVLTEVTGLSQRMCEQKGQIHRRKVDRDDHREGCEGAVAAAEASSNPENRWAAPVRPSHAGGKRACRAGRSGREGR